MTKNEQIKPGNESLGELELKANLNPEQRAYLEVLKDKMKKILGSKTKQELAKARDLTSLKNYKAVLEEILQFLRTKEMKDIKMGINLEEYKERQLERLEDIKDSLGSDEDSLELLEHLNSQISMILTRLKNMTHVLETKDIEILETHKIPNADQIIKALILALDLLPEDIFLLQQFLDQNGHVVRADFGQVGKPGIGLKYLLKGQFSEPVGYHSNTCLTIFRKGMDEPMLFETIGYYENGKWLLQGNKTL